LPHQDFESRLRALDWKLLRYAPNQTSVNDRISLLALQNACRDAHGSFEYLEIGSFLGGSLQSFVADPHCAGITSIDPRTESAPDTRGTASYPNNSVEAMLSHLERVPDADLSKLRTIEASTEDIDPADVVRPQLALLDGEHTIEAALRDARFCRNVMRGEGTIAFHDRDLVWGAIEQFLAELDPAMHTSHALPDYLYVVEIGPPLLSESRWLSDLRDG
jgi:methyltransferase family protein